MNRKKLLQQLSAISDKLSKVPNLKSIRYDTEKVLQVDQVISEVLIEIDHTIDEVKCSQ